MNDIIQKVTASVAVIINDKILILKRAKDDLTFPGLWELPSGKKEPLENIQATAVREAKEETGLDVKIIDILDTFNFQVKRENHNFDVTQIVFLAESSGQPVKISDEHEKHAWVNEKDLDQYNLSKETKKAIRKAFSRQL